MPTAISTSSNDPYFDLIQSFPLRPIRTRAAHQRAKTVLRGLAGRRGSAVRDYKAVLGSLIADYERLSRLQLDTSNVTAAQVLRHLLGQRGTSIAVAAKELRIPRNTLGDLLSGKAEWSKSLILQLSNHFGVHPELFLR